ncbi:MAG TPA: universal stress protein [Acidimicrobiia bacterium]|nr:universal stress protein [Acidimicrobiia bacterium]
MGTSFLVGLAVTWILTGVVLSVVMRRRGHDLYTWLALGSILGPLAVPLALERLRTHPVAVVVEPETGDRDVLVGVDGSRESVIALHDALALLGPHVTSLTIATVLDHDSRDTPAGDEDREAARHLLDAVIAEVGREGVRSEILYGRPEEALTAYARAAGVDVIVVGARGRGASRTFFGSVAGRIVGASDVPVLVGRRVRG